jgi:crossover junction endodeoxyribonuclease RuvC
MRVLGIDPGATGALVLLEDGQPIEWTEMPTLKIGTATRVNAPALADWIASTCCTQVYVEQVHAMPGQGVTSMFNFGHSCGTVMGVLGAMGIPHTLVTPQAWKKAAGLIGTDKDAARARAIQLWPKWRELDKKGKGQALADAALIASHGELT